MARRFTRTISRQAWGLACLLSACASSPIKHYSGPARPASQIATLAYSGNAFFGCTTLLYKIDGKYGPNQYRGNWRYNSALSGDFVVELAPGEHEFTMGLECAGLRSSERSIRNKDYKATLQPGKTYTISVTKVANLTYQIEITPR